MAHMVEVVPALKSPGATARKGRSRFDPAHVCEKITIGLVLPWGFFSHPALPAQVDVKFLNFYSMF